MSDTATTEATPTSDPVAAIPDTGGDAGDFSFEAALEASINAVEAPAEEAPVQVEETKKEEAAETATEATEETKPEAEATTEAEAEATDPEDGSNDLLDSLDADIGDDWTPKASSAFQRLKTELKAEHLRREQKKLRQKSLSLKEL